jgi:hypothetical protein
MVGQCRMRRLKAPQILMEQEECRQHQHAQGCHAEE